ncbi:MAG: hypothetical protein AAFR68_08330 [Pseudomonadota bacterium]
MPFLNDNVFDNGLAWLQSNGSRIDVCSQEPTTYAEATSTYSLGNKTGLSMNAIDNASPDGREVTCPEITDGVITGNGNVTHWALTDGTGVLIATGALVAAQAVTNGNPFTLTETVVGRIRDAT